MTATDLKRRAIALAEKTKIDSVTPEEVGQLSNDIVEYIENVEINGSSLGIRKTYTSVSAMEADSTAPKDDKGVLLRRGMLVNIYNQSDPDSADNGKVFSFQNPGWAFRGTVDAGYATKEELTELSNNVGLYNVDTNIPLESGFYTSAAARKSVPIDIRKQELIITYKTDSKTCVIEQYTGTSFSDGTWMLDENWNRFISKKEIFQLVSESFLSNLVDKNCSLYNYLKIVDGLDYDPSVGGYISNDNVFYVEIAKENCPNSILFVNQKLKGNKPIYFAYIKGGSVNKNTNIGTYGIKFTSDFDKVQLFFNKSDSLVYLTDIITIWNKTYDLPTTTLNDYKIRGNSMLDVDNAISDVNINVNVNGYLESRADHKTYPLFKVTKEDKIWANKYYNVAFFAFDDKANIIKNGTFKTQTGLGMQASYFQMSDYAELEGLDHIYLGVSSSMSDLVVTNDKVSNSAEYWVKNPDLPELLECVEEAPTDDNQYCRKNREWVKIEAGGTGLEDTKTYNLFDGEVTNAYITPDKGIETPNTGYRVTANFIPCPSEGVVSVKGVTGGHIYCYKNDGTYLPQREQNTQGASEPYLMFIAQKGTEKIKFEYLERNKTGDIIIKIGGGANSLPYTEPTKQAIPYNKLQLLRSINMLDMRYWWTDKIIDILADSIGQNPGYPYFIDLSLGSMTQWHGIGGTRLSGNASNAFWQDIRINSLADNASLILIGGGTNDRSSYTLGDLTKENTDTNTLCGAINVLLSKLYYRYMGMDGYYSSISYAGVNRVTERNINILFILPPKVIETNNKVIEISDDIISVLNLWGIPYVDTCRLSGINEMNKLWFYKHYTDGTIIDPTHGQMPFFERISRLIVDKILQITPIADIEGVEATTKTYTVSYNNGDGYTLEAYNNSVSPVEEGGEYSVRLNILEGYDGSNAIVKSNDKVVERDDTLSSEGLDIYTVKNITQDITITVEGVIVE